jgi:hypothetical protein
VLGLFGYYRRLVCNFADIARPLTELLRTTSAEPATDRLADDEERNLRAGHAEYREWRDKLARERGEPLWPEEQWTEILECKLKVHAQRRARARTQAASAPKKRAQWKWGPRQQEAFETLKRRLVTAPILAHPDFTSRFYVHTDASAHAIEAVLTQFQDERERVIAYYSATLTGSEQKWTTTEREACAIFQAVKRFHAYLAGAPFTVVTDHAALKYLLGMRDPTGRIARWLTFLHSSTPLRSSIVVAGPMQMPTRCHVCLSSRSSSLTRLSVMSPWWEQLLQLNTRRREREGTGEKATSATGI